MLRELGVEPIRKTKRRGDRVSPIRKRKLRLAKGRSWKQILARWAQKFKVKASR